MTDELDNIHKALMAFQDECPKIKKGEYNPFHKSKYAGITAIWDIIQPLLKKYKLLVIQPIVDRTIETTLIHIPSGDELTSRCPIICRNENSPQDFGSAVTYMRRYSLSAILGIVFEADDDGEGAQGRGENNNTDKSFF